jgi:protein-S-isoprenylcysteine O-methyltransferase Ste14
MQAEEALLGQHFGEAYAAYCAHTWRLALWVY